METASTKPTVRLKSFEGPLDLLLFLIQRSELNIYDIPIAEITEQYLGYLQLAVNENLDNLTDFYAMAATLIYIKSRMLLPVDLDMDEQFEDPRQELVDKLIAYHKYKKYAEVIEDHYNEGDYFFIRGKRQQTLPFEEKELWDEIDVWDLLKTFSSLLSNISPEKIFNIYEEVSVKEKLTLMDELFGQHEEISFEQLITREGSALDVICAFFAVLEAVKYEKIIIFQNTLFGTIKIKLHEKYKKRLQEAEHA